MEDIVLIPAYKPDDTLMELVDQLHAQGLGILVVNDGSSNYYERIFQSIMDKATVVSLPDNSGKGAALKFGLSNVLRLFPRCRHIITADADGQHRVEDILRVRDVLNQGAQFVLTLRQFQKNMPLRSKFGNALSRVIYTLLTGHYLPDNQSGLRGFSAEQIQWLLQVGGNKYDYEMNMLYYADKQGIPITTLGIEAIYIDGNKSSHFDPLVDTLRIYRRLFASAWVSFASFWIVEVILFLDMAVCRYLPVMLVPNGLLHMLMVLPTAGSVGAAFNVTMNKFIAFRRVRYADTTRTLMYTLLRYIGYSVGCTILCYFYQWALFPAFNVVAVLMMPIEYFLHKLIRLALYKDINRI